MNESTTNMRTEEAIKEKIKEMDKEGELRVGW